MESGKVSRDRINKSELNVFENPESNVSSYAARLLSSSQLIAFMMCFITCDFIISVLNAKAISEFLM